MCCLYHRSPQSDKEYNQWTISWNKTNMTKVFHFLWLKRGLNLGDIIIDVVDVIRGWTKLKPCTHQMLCEKRMWERSALWKKPKLYWYLLSIFNGIKALHWVSYPSFQIITKVLINIQCTRKQNGMLLKFINVSSLWLITLVW